jgi:dipeptidase D
VLKEKSMLKLLRSIYACPNGIMAMSQTVPGLVETSTNLASVNFKKNNSAEIVTSQRSSLESDKHDTANSIESAFLLADAKVWHSDSYPGWTPNKNSEILETATKSYETLFSKEPAIKAIHAGLECGLFLEKYPHLDMISIGPTMRGVHSPDERLHIESVEKYWRFVEQIISEIPEEEAK